MPANFATLPHFSDSAAMKAANSWAWSGIGTVLPGPPSDFGKLIAEETEKWAKVVKFAGIKPE